MRAHICCTQVFGEQTGSSSISLSVLAVELLQAATKSGHSAFAREERSLAGHVHMRLLDLVRDTTHASGKDLKRNEVKASA